MNATVDAIRAAAAASAAAAGIAPAVGATNESADKALADKAAGALSDAAATASQGNPMAPTTEGVDQSKTVEGLQATVAALQAQLLQAMNIIAGKATATVEPLTEPVVFHSANPHIRFPVIRQPGHCEFIHFVGGKYSTSDPLEVKLIDAAIASGGSGFSRAPITGPSKEEVEMLTDVFNDAAIAQKKMIQAGEKTA